ncbi:hypothetical protein [Micromonospora sp. NPDC049645]|uniref:hypothetical protein n=1 Tax=Micromonospora sp. NPDC049645 TaxID=3155508 RepID=UPI00342E6232
MSVRPLTAWVARRPPSLVDTSLPVRPRGVDADPCGNRQQRRNAARLGMKPPTGCGCPRHGAAS